MSSQELLNECRPNRIVTRGFIFLLALAIVGCSSNNVAQKGKGTAQAGVPSPSSTIAVIPNPYVDDLTLANRAAEEAKQELVKRGYKVVANEAEADLVAIPTVENTEVVRMITAVKPVDLFRASGEAQLDRPGSVANSLGSLGSLPFRSSTDVGGTRNGLLVIEAFRRDAWDKALIVNELQLLPVWKIKVSLPGSLQPAVEGAAAARTADTDFVLPR